ncbi:MAG: STAS/SEC14 domain-containing protein [Flavobacteriales bacterium]|nr:MAG: STAS/SEC14 domain-containing protein [Flavobacteriales bacterium]
MKELLEETTSQNIYWDSENKIVHGVLIANLTTLEDAIENIDAQERIKNKMNREKTRVLIDMSSVSEISKEARNYFSNERTASIQRATALYINSVVGRVIGNFFMGINKPLTPTKIFTDKKAAIKWLHAYKDE